MPTIEDVALLVEDLERACACFERSFAATSSDIYVNVRRAHASQGL